MLEPLFDVVEVQIAPPHYERVLTTGKKQADAQAYADMAVMRRGVEHSFFTIRSYTP